ncbi:hypothetical protein J7I98_30940 [Streptomyces sp. ISL-98]|uniref:hypothetical protein n=1 Tax=Streptomyces sp. ISL-98 TaxID=2819192 RepID=UPI001BE7B23E|nr:hypothetical protein [Streptomyces sp. ISL-98]MBT2510194.1 hypothetical protein [Streptomyces sp. ISL-98]
MIDVVLPELPQRELSLKADGPVRGPGDPAPPPPLGGRILLGGPVSVPLDAKAVAHDAELQAFVEGEADSAVYHLLHLSITCEKDSEGPALHTVDVDLTLTADADADADTGAGAGAGAAAIVGFQPVAWSMTPKQLTETVESTTSAQLGPQLAFVGYSRTSQQSRVCLEALRELRSDPGWAIRHTRTAKIGGTYRLAMVVRAPRGAKSRAAVAVGAAVRKGHVMRRYREEMPDPVSLVMDL